MLKATICGGFCESFIVSQYLAYASSALFLWQQGNQCDFLEMLLFAQLRFSEKVAQQNKANANVFHDLLV